MRALATIFEVLTVLGAIVGALAVIWAVRSLGIGGANDITLAASSAFAVAVTALPYCTGGQSIAMLCGTLPSFVFLIDPEVADEKVPEVRRRGAG